MNRAALALVLLAAAASSASADSSSGDLGRRAEVLIQEIRAESGSPSKDKDVARLRAELNALKAENSAAQDAKIAASLKEAEDDLSLVDAGSPLPPPRPSDFPVEDLPDRDAVAAPVSPATHVPALQKAASAADAAGGVFDGSLQRGGGAPSAPAVAVPSKDAAADPTAPQTAELKGYLDLADDDSRDAFLNDVCVDLVSRLGLPDPDGKGAARMAKRLRQMLEQHPKRSNFTSVKLVASGGWMHLVYDTSDAAGIDEQLNIVYDLMSDHAKGPKPKRGRKKRKKGGGGGGGGGDGDDSGGGSKKHGHHKGGGGGDGGGDDGGDGDGGGGGSGGGHAKVPHVKGGGADGSAFDGNDASGDVAGPGGRHGRGGRGRHGGSASASADDDEGGDGDGGGNGGGNGGGAGRGGRTAGGESSGRFGSAHAGAEGSVSSGQSGDDGGGASGDGEGKKAKVPLPKDFTTHGGGPGLSEPGGDPVGMPHFTPKTYVKNGAPSPASAAGPGSASPLPAANPALSAANGAAGPAPAGAPNAPVAPEDEQLRDAVAAHSADSPRLDLPRAAPGQDSTPADSDDSPFPWPAASAAAGAGLLLGAHLIRRRAEKQAKAAAKSAALD